MEEVIAGLQGFTFAFELDVESQKGTGLLPFQGMDKSSSAVCNFFAKGLCVKGNCSNKECLFLHLKPVLKLQDCPWYNQGFCKEVGPLCKYRHVHQVLCPNYFTGFCPEGPQCQFGHCSLSTSHGIQQLLLATLWCPLSRQSPWSTVRGGGVCLRPAAQGHTLHLRPPCQQSKLYPLEPSKPSLKRGSWTFS
eukprot:XP_017170147.1 PREDICTED: putative cleavage and polyadenylation specificity factor subunit 4-like protein isoform X11 [Mus musculus]